MVVKQGFSSITLVDLISPANLTEDFLKDAVLLSIGSFTHFSPIIPLYAHSTKPFLD
jgi:hypothetical protein